MDSLQPSLSVSYGYSFALELESKAAWKPWLGEEEYQRLTPYLASESAWTSFMSLAKEGEELREISLLGKEGDVFTNLKDQPRLEMEASILHLQLLVRSLFFYANAETLYGGKMEVCSFCPDGVYFLLEHDADDWLLLQSQNSPVLEALQEKVSITPSTTTEYGLNEQEETTLGRNGCGNEEDKSGGTDNRDTLRSKKLSDLQPKPIQAARTLDQEKQAELNNALEGVITGLKALGEISEPFLHKVKKTEAPDYYQVIKRPMDLGMMLKKVRNSKYNNKRAFQVDIDLIVANCRQYNEKGSVYSRHAAIFQASCNQLLASVPDIEILKVGTNEMAQLANSMGETEGEHPSLMSTPESTSGLPPFLDDMDNLLETQNFQKEPGVREFASMDQKEGNRGTVPDSGEANGNARKGIGIQKETGSNCSDYGDSWYELFLRTNRVERMQRLAYRISQQRLPFGEQEAIVRNSKGMSDFLAASDLSIRRKLNSKPPMGRVGEFSGNGNVEGGGRAPEDIHSNATLNKKLENFRTGGLGNEAVPNADMATSHLFFPEIQFPGNCVPQNVLPYQKSRKRGWNSTSFGQENLGLSSLKRKLDSVSNENVREKNGGGREERSRKKDRVVNWTKVDQKMKESLAKTALETGFEGVKERAVEMMADSVKDYLGKLGKCLRILVDRFGRDCQPIEILTMCVENGAGCSMEELQQFFSTGNTPDPSTHGPQGHTVINAGPGNSNLPTGNVTGVTQEFSQIVHHQGIMGHMSQRHQPLQRQVMKVEKTFQPPTRVNGPDNASLTSAPRATESQAPAQQIGNRILLEQQKHQQQFKQKKPQQQKLSKDLQQSQSQSHSHISSQSNVLQVAQPSSKDAEKDKPAPRKRQLVTSRQKKGGQETSPVAMGGVTDGKMVGGSFSSTQLGKP